MAHTYYDIRRYFISVCSVLSIASVVVAQDAIIQTQDHIVPHAWVGSGDEFGYAVSLDSGRLLVGSPRQLDLLSWRDVLLFNFDTTWSAAIPLSPPLGSTGNEGSWYGKSVSILGDTAVVGAPNKSFTDGSIFIFTNTGGNSWSDGFELAKSWCATFFPWYNNEHRHEGIGLFTPSDVYTGRHMQLTHDRQRVLDAAFASHPKRFVRGRAKTPIVPNEVWINRTNENIVSNETKSSETERLLSPFGCTTFGCTTFGCTTFGCTTFGGITSGEKKPDRRLRSLRMLNDAEFYCEDVSKLLTRSVSCSMMVFLEGTLCLIFLLSVFHNQLR